MRNGPLGSISLGNWLGMPIRLHVSFVLMAVFVMFIMTRGTLENMGTHGLLLIAVWFACVVLHEAGHCVAVARMGGSNDAVVLAPFGGLSYHSYIQDPQRELLAAIAGPLVNVAGWLASSCILYALHDVSIVGLLNPFYPQDLLASGPWLVVAARMAVWVNWCLVLVNLLPATPFDGGWALRTMLWPTLGHRRSLFVVQRVTIVTAVTLCLVAWWLGDTGLFAVPAWLPLVTIAAYSCCFAMAPKQPYDDEQEEEDLFGYDFSSGYTSLEGKVDSPPQQTQGLIHKWIIRRRAMREERRIQVENDEERQVDGILQRLHEHGIESLSPHQRALLNRVAARYRSRTGE